MPHNTNAPVFAHVLAYVPQTTEAPTSMLPEVKQLLETDEIRPETHQTGIPAKPGSLCPCVAERSPHRGLHRRVHADVPLDQIEGLSVSDAASDD